MNGYLAPMNFNRARDLIARLQTYTSYTPEGAEAVHELLRQSYPMVFSRLQEKRFANGAVLLETQGTGRMGPLVFVSRLDAEKAPDAAVGSGGMCVPLERAHLIALLEALEALLYDGFVPTGDLILCLSMDGLDAGEGARAMADHLRTRAVHPCYVLDHGGYVAEDTFRTFLKRTSIGTLPPLALIGITEKAVYRAEATPRAGEEKPATVLLRAGSALTRHARKEGLCNASRIMLDTVGRQSRFLRKWSLSKASFMFPLLRARWHGRTVTKLYLTQEREVTECDLQNRVLRFGGTLLPGTKTADEMKRLRRLLGRKVDISFPVALDASPRSDTRGESWDALITAIQIQFDCAVAVPTLSPYRTDARFYAGLGACVYRFSPFLLTEAEARRGVCALTDDTLQCAVQFFRGMLSV